MASMNRELGFIEVFSITSGAMISSGLFILPGIAHAQAGPAVVISYMISGLLAISGMLCTVEIVTAMPVAGGNYFFISRTMGPAAGSVAGLLSWFALSLKSSFALVGISAFLTIIVDWGFHIIGLSACLIFIVVNIIGSKESGRVQVILITSLLVFLLLYTVFGLLNMEGGNILPFAPQGWGPVFSAAGLIFISYGGLLQVGSIAEEIRNPGRTIPLAMTSAFVSVLLLYVLVVFVTTGVLDSQTLNQSLTPVSDGASAVMGLRGAILMSIAAILAFISTANSGILTASRYLLGLSRDQLLPPFFGKINRRFQTPHIAVVITGIFVMATLFLRIEILAEAASTVLILNYALACICLIILRESRIFNYKPKFNAPWYPLLPIAGIVGYIVLLFGIGLNTIIISVALILAGLIFYALYGKRRADREFALLHVVERFSDRELTEGMLESELKEIVRQRDLIDPDRFDALVERSIVIDCSPCSLETFFQRIGRTLEENYHLDPVMVEQALVERHQRHSAIIEPGYAVSDIVIEGQGFFELMMVRCREGMPLEKDSTKVHIMFFLVTTRDERDFYVRAFSLIAQIIHNSSFKQQWLDARNPQQLRDLVVLGTRRRDSG
jgi:basic amino acid/polyamine antiporter, APA family